MGIEFRVSFSIDGASFEDAPATEVGRILRETASRVEDGETDFTIRDANGNSIGRIWVGPEAR